MKYNRVYFLVVSILLAFFLFIPGVLASNIAIGDGFADWTTHPMHVDPGGADDENSPASADVTEFSADSDDTGLYLLMAWDNTSFNPSGTAAGVTTRGANNQYYRIYATMAGSPPGVALASLDINTCGTDINCASSQTDVCQGTGCTGAQVSTGTTWTTTWNDPFQGRASPSCSGTNCGALDSAVEIYIPWTILGGQPQDGRMIFLRFGSYPSGPAQAPKDNTGSNGIACINDEGVYTCYLSTPTAVELVTLKASSMASPGGWSILVVAALAGILPALIFHKRSWQAN